MAQFGPFALDTARRQVTRDGHDVHLTPKAYELLSLLVAEAPRVVPKSELHERLWPGTFVSDATLVGLVKELRRALQDRNPRARIIRTAHGVGYAIDRSVERVPTRSTGVWHWIVAGGRRILLRDGANVVGRGPDSHVWLDVAGVSRRHASVIVAGANVWLEDLGSKNGTSIGREPVTAATTLADGDVITCGPVDLQFRRWSERSSIVTERVTRR